LKKIVLDVYPDSEGKIYLRGSDYHYLVHVRRVRAGAVLDAVLPDGAEALLTVLGVEDFLTANCNITVKSAGTDCSPIYLFQALPQGLKMDLIVRQAAECGVTGIIPFFSENSQIRKKPTGNAISDGSGSKTVFAEKIRRWDRIIKEARQQSGSTIPTTVHSPCDFEEIFIYWKNLGPDGAGILFHQNPLAPGTLHDYLCNNPVFAAAAIGPEGGFSPAEVSRFLAEGFRPFAVSGTVFRTETAALYGTAAIRTILAERSYWHLKKNHPPGDA